MLLVVETKYDVLDEIPARISPHFYRGAYLAPGD